MSLYERVFLAESAFGRALIRKAQGKPVASDVAFTGAPRSKEWWHDTAGKKLGGFKAGEYGRHTVAPTSNRRYQPDDLPNDPAAQGTRIRLAQSRSRGTTGPVGSKRELDRATGGEFSRPGYSVGPDRS